MTVCYNVLIRVDQDRWISFKGYRTTRVDGEYEPCSIEDTEQLLRNVLPYVAEIKYDFYSIEIKLKSGVKLVLNVVGDWSPGIAVTVS